MKYLKTRVRVFPIIATFSIILGFCYSSKSFSQTVKVFSMKLTATKFLDFQNHDLLVLSFQEELIGSKYVAEGKVSPDPTPRKIRLKKYSDSTFNGYNLRVLVLPKNFVIKFISDLSSIDHINLAAQASEYNIIFKATPETDSLGNYINYTIRARNKNTGLMSTMAAKTNPCPPCRYSSTQ